MQMARPEGPCRCFGNCSFVEERRSESFRLCNALAEEAIKRSAEARSAEALQKGEARKARPEGPSRRGTLFMLRPAGPKVEARRAEAKFCGFHVPIYKMAKYVPIRLF